MDSFRYQPFFPAEKNLYFLKMGKHLCFTVSLYSKKALFKKVLYTIYDAKRVFSLFEALEVNQVLQFIHRYEVDNSSRKNRLKNMKMNKNKNKKYDEDPRCFWNDRET